MLAAPSESQLWMKRNKDTSQNFFSTSVLGWGIEGYLPSICEAPGFNPNTPALHKVGVVTQLIILALER